MNEQKINDLKNALKEFMQLISQEKEFSEEILLMISQVMEHIASRIQQLRQEEQESVEGLGPSISQPELQSAGYPSAQINAFKYDPENENLFVKFQGKYPQENGPVYRYSNIPQNIFNLFKRGAVAPKTSGKNAWHEWKKGLAPSLGASLNALIKSGGYPYLRLS